jgi:uncharacterized repeat protein (TIGR03803 family)
MKSNQFWVAASNLLAAATAMLIMVLLLTPGASAASKFKTLYTFTGGADGGAPWDTLIFDQAGNLYGTTGGAEQSPGPTPGNVFKLTPNGDGTWTESVLYSFTGGADGGSPMGSLVFDQTGNLYGTTQWGGSSNCQYGCGVVFKLTPNQGGSWTESVLYSFTGGNDGSQSWASLIFDATGNLYGTTASGGNPSCNQLFSGCGTVFKLAPNADGSWTESVLYRFAGGRDGSTPVSNLIFDKSGNLYSTTWFGGPYSGCTDWKGTGCGVVFKLTPKANGNWKEKVLYRLTIQDGFWPVAGLIFDRERNLYGTAQHGGAYGYGSVFKLTPSANGTWKEKVLHSFTYKDGYNPTTGSLILDKAGSLYGTAAAGGAYGPGVVFKLARGSGGKWAEHVLHSFTGGSDGGNPLGGLIFDAAGNLYGTTEGNGSTTFGSVFEITR